MLCTKILFLFFCYKSLTINTFKNNIIVLQHCGEKTVCHNALYIKNKNKLKKKNSLFPKRV